MEHNVSRPQPAEDPATDAGGAVLVRYWAGARAAAGVDEDRVPPGSVASALAQVTGRHPGLSAVAEVSTLLVDGRVVDAEHELSDGDVLEVLPPFAGG